MSTYYFLLGSHPELSLWELRSLLPGSEFSQVADQLYAVELDANPSAVEKLIYNLGGTVKIYTQVATDVADEASLLEKITSHLADKAERPKFGLAHFGTDGKKPSVGEVKQSLAERNVPCRYIEGEMSGLSASVLLHQKSVIELGIIKTETGYSLAEALAVQDIDEWTHRDRHKPYASRQKGMLPPKLARMMVNFGLGAAQAQGETAMTDLTLYDPFCGTGTVLIEAALLEMNVIGSDASPESTQGTELNLEWASEQYELNTQTRVILTEASQASNFIKPQTVDLIVTEPFLGKQTPQAKLLPNIYKGLEKMYLGAFKDWTKILKDQASVVIIFPSVETESKTFDLAHLIDKLADLGYTISSGPVEYARPGAVVKRNIYQFTYVKS